MKITNKKITTFFLTMILILGLQVILSAADNVATQNVTVTVDSIATLAVANNAGVALRIVAPTAGNMPENATNNATYLNYSTNISTNTDVHRTITAQLNKPTPSSYNLKLSASGITGNGEAGSVTTPITLTNSSAAPIVTNIGNCFTGIGAFGANLLYATDIMHMPSQETSEYLVTFTLTEESI